MPIIDFPYYLDSLTLEATIRGSGRILAYEEVDGLNASDGDVRATVYGTGTIFSNVGIDGIVYTGALIPATGSLTFTADPIVTALISATITTEGSIECTLSYSEGRAYLPSLVGFASDYETLSGLTYLPSLFSTADLGWYVPPELVGGYALLTGLTSAGLIKQPELGEGYLPSLVSQGWLYTTSLDEEFVQPFFMEAGLRGRLTLSPNLLVDGHYTDNAHATISGTGTVYNNITIDGVTYTGGLISGVGSLTNLAVTATTYLQSTITSTGTFNPSNDLGQSDPWSDIAIGFGYIPSLHSYAYTGTRLEATFDSYLFLFNAKVGYGIYTHSFDDTLLFTDQYIGVLASAIYTEILATQTMNTSSVFSGVVSSVSIFDSGLTLTSLQEAHKAFINTFTSSLSTSDSYSALIEQLVSFAGSLTVADIYEGIKTVLGTFLSTLTFDDAVTALADIQATFFSTLRDSDTYLPIVSTTAAPLVGSCATWVIDVDTQASVQYDRFSFNSYAQRGTDYLAAAEDGIYLLDGDTDAGTDISALVDLAVSRFATPQRKYFPSVYLGVTSTGKMLLKAEVDGQTWIYEANNTTTNIANQRIDLGKGLIGSHWRFTLLNQDGLDFELESVEFLPFISSRRVY